MATFYTMYKRRPTGRHLVSVCTNTLCNVLGGQRIYEPSAAVSSWWTPRSADSAS